MATTPFSKPVVRDFFNILLAGETPPEDPVRTDPRERAAAAILAAYRPGWFTRLFGLTSRRKARLAVAIEKARAGDDEAHRKKVAEAARRRDAVKFAQSSATLQAQEIPTALNKHANLDGAAIEAVSVLVVDGRVIAVIDAFELDDMPTQSVSLLQSGKATSKALTAGKVRELHRDNICSSAIRVAAEFLQALPIQAVEVVVQTDLLDRASGQIIQHPVLYARITAQALSTVNLEMTDATPLAELLEAQFDWSRKEGFRPINLGAFDLPLELLGENGKLA